MDSLKYKMKDDANNTNTHNNREYMFTPVKWTKRMSL